MLLRFVAENIASFKDAVEFNTFPSSKSHSHENHKIACGHATALRMSAIYGANGAGKSNLLVILNFLKGLVEVGSIRDVEFFDALYFKFAPSCKDKPSGLAIEFYHQDNNAKYVFYLWSILSYNALESKPCLYPYDPRQEVSQWNRKQCRAMWTA